MTDLPARTLALIDPKNLSLIRLLFAVAGDRLGKDYQAFEQSLAEAEKVVDRPAIVFRRLSGNEFAAGLRGRPLARLQQRRHSGALAELHQVLAAGGSVVLLNGTPDAIRHRLRGAVDHIRKRAGSVVGDALDEGLHVGASGAWFDWLGVGEVIVA
ncbi:hypothetical protein D8I24_5672 [Cupriavidus necator H850]|uniref:hypothetical protein n=1 Tax=Cupriavidus necator TaxID=106590 RepID=UPI00129DEC07|nr:hypothetical protein [Cupriavidus necator]KAI3598726.1 hypothetical protein D8I24_5672 [Cupriavidus necator H850]